MTRIPVLISAKELVKRLGSSSNTRLLDCSWYLPSQRAQGKDARQEYDREHIAGARFFDIDACSAPNTPYEHMLPTAEHFDEFVSALGISNEHHVTVYDNNSQFGLFSAPRVWWMFRMFGHDSVSVLNGGLPAWKALDQPVTDKMDPATRGTYKSTEFRGHLLKSFEDMVENIESRKFQTMDARSAGRFKGEAPEPRADVKPGHMVGALSVPFSDVLLPEGKGMKSPEELVKTFSSAGLDLDGPITATCGSGITACVLALAAHEAGKTDVAVYDGSWLEFYLRSKPQHKVNVPNE